jgi:hypothetical protein
MELNVFPDDVNMGEGGAPTDIQHSLRPDDGQLTDGTAPPPPVLLHFSFACPLVTAHGIWVASPSPFSSALKSRSEFVVPDSSLNPAASSTAHSSAFL